MIAAGIPTKALASAFHIDKNASRFYVRAFATGLLASMGHNPTLAIRDFSGEICFDPGDAAASSVRVRVRTDSLEVVDDIRIQDRRDMESTMNQAVLESAKYPEIAFESKELSWVVQDEHSLQAKITGWLALHGVTGLLSIPAQVAVFSDMLRGSGEFSILQTAYNIHLVSVAGGALKLNDELKFSFDFVARKQE